MLRYSHANGATIEEAMDALDATAAAGCHATGRFLYQRSYLDVNRLTDGTVWNWQQPRSRG